jgi:hypothetical protein
MKHFTTLFVVVAPLVGITALSMFYPVAVLLYPITCHFLHPKRKSK